MRFTKHLLIVFLLFSFTAEAQVLLQDYKVQKRPHGKEIFFLKKGVDFSSIPKKYDDPWTEIELICYIKHEDAVESKLNKGTVLYNFLEDSIGYIIAPVEWKKSDRYLMFTPSHPMQCVLLNGYIDEEIAGDGLFRSRGEYIFQDSCVSSIRQYIETDGQPCQITNNCTIYTTYLLGRTVTVKEHLETLLIHGAADNLYYMTVEMRWWSADSIVRKVISADALAFSTYKDLIYLTEEGIGIGPHFNHQYCLETGERIMTFQGNPRLISDESNTETLYLGYCVNYEGFRKSNFIGSIYVSNDEELIYSRKIFCDIEEIAKKVLYFEPKIKFVLKSKNDHLFYPESELTLGSTSARPSDLSGFGFILTIPYESIDGIDLEFQFRNGELYLIKNYQDAFYLED